MERFTVKHTSINWYIIHDAIVNCCFVIFPSCKFPSNTLIQNYPFSLHQVRKSTAAPIVLAHTRNDEDGHVDMQSTCDMCERLGAAGWETTSASSGENVHMVFDLCISAALEAKVKFDNKKDRLVRPNTLKLPSLAKNFENNKSKTSVGNNKHYSDHVYEDPEDFDTSTAKKVRNKSSKNRNKSVITRQHIVQSPQSQSSVILESDDTRNLCLRSATDQSVFSPQSSQSVLKSPSPTLLSPTPSSSDMDAVPRRWEMVQTNKILFIIMYKNKYNQGLI